MSKALHGFVEQVRDALTTLSKQLSKAASASKGAAKNEAAFAFDTTVACSPWIVDKVVPAALQLSTPHAPHILHSTGTSHAAQATVQCHCEHAHQDLRTAGRSSQGLAGIPAIDSVVLAQLKHDTPYPTRLSLGCRLVCCLHDARGRAVIGTPNTAVNV